MRWIGRSMMCIAFQVLCTQWHGSFAQTSLTGEFKDHENNGCLFATIAVKNASDSSMVAYASADSIGKFTFTIPFVSSEREYFMQVYHPEFQDTTLFFSLAENQEEQNFGTIILNELVDTLGEVVINGRVPILEKKIDRLAFNIENTSNANGKNVLELLGKTPLVMVQNRSISVVGKPFTIVMLNDRALYLSGDDLAQYLESIPSEEVVRIEVITNPPSKYDANGGALINVVIRKNRMLGTNGNLTASHTQAYYGYERTSLVVNHRRKKLNLYGTLSARKGENRFTEYTKYEFTDHYNEQHDVTNQTTDGLRGSLGLDYFITEKTTLSASWETNASERSIITGSELDYMANAVYDSLVAVRINSGYSFIYNAANANFHSELDSTGKTLNINANYLSNDSKLTHDFLANTYNSGGLASVQQLKSETSQLIQVGTFDADLRIPKKSGEWSFGGKVNWIGNYNDNLLKRDIDGQTQDDSLQNRSFDYDEKTAALFGMYYKQWEKSELQIGLRGEYTQLTGKIDNTESPINRTFTAVFPTIYYLRTLSDKFSLSASVGRRIDRPGYSSLNPFRKYLTTVIYREGNPLLRPTYLTDGSIDFTINNRYYISAIYTNFQNSYMEIPLVTSTNGIAYVQENIGNTNQYGLSANIPFNLGGHIENSLVLVYLYSQFKSNSASFESTGTNIVFANFNSYFSITKTLSGDLSVVARPFGSIYTLSVMESQYIVGFGLRQKLMKGRLILSCNVSDILKGGVPRSTVRSENFMIYTNNYYDGRSLVFSVNYKFGNRYIKNKSGRENGAESEKNRI